MLRMVARDRSTAVTMPTSAPETNVMSEDSIATSVPVPIADPTSAWARAGASLMPSPTMPTTLPSACRRRTSAALWSGITSATTRVMPTWRAIAAAVCRLSPVIITTSMPRAWRAATAAGAPSLRVSATATTPAGCPSTATSIAVLPSAASRSWAASRTAASTPNASSSRRLPTSTGRPSTRAITPWPVTDSNPSTSGTASPRSVAPATIAAASGCSEARSTPATAARRRSSPPSVTGMTSVRAGTPRVRVPVLSRMIVCNLWAVSKASAERIRMPCAAPLPVPTVIDMGVASPRAQGQAMISTDTAATSAKMNTGGGPTSTQATKVHTAITITAGTK